MATCTTKAARGSAAACLQEQMLVLVERDEELNLSKMEWVEFPASPAAPGAQGQISANGTNGAIYVPGFGWRFWTLSENII